MAVRTSALYLIGMQVPPGVMMLGLLLAAACSDGPTGGSGRLPAEMRLVSAPSSTGTPGWPLADSVVVEVLDDHGDPVSGVYVNWSGDNGSDIVTTSIDTTNALGRISASWTLGRNEGQQTLQIGVRDLTPLTVHATATLLHATAVTVGGAFACALTESGETFCWGSNQFGQLGNGSVGASSFVPVATAGPVFQQVSAAGYHACGLTANGTAYCWGGNQDGETGIGVTSDIVPIPTPVQTSLRFTHLSAQGSGTLNSTCALTAMGKVWCWGDNTDGKLGNGSTTDSPVPVQVQSGATFASIYTGYFHSCGLADAGELLCWGAQQVEPGAFGANPVGSYPTPVLLQDDFRFTQIVAGWNFTCGLTTEDVAWCWGTNFSGGLGRNQLEGSAIPLEVAGGLSIMALTQGSYKEMHALTRDGFVYRWGDIGGNNRYYTPYQINDFRFLQIDGGDDPFDEAWSGVCGITEGGGVYCLRDDGWVKGVPAPAP